MAGTRERDPVRKAFDLLKAVSELGGGRTLTEIAAAADIPPSTALRLLSSLVTAGALWTDGDRRYWPGAAVVRESWVPESHLPAPVRAELQALADGIREAVHLHVRVGHQRGILAVVNPVNPHRVQSVYRPRELTNLDRGAGAWAILAHTRPEVLDPYLATLEPHVRSETQRQMAHVREEGWVQSFNARGDGVKGLAVPVLGVDGTHPGSDVVAVVLSVPDQREVPEHMIEATIATASGLADLDAMALVW